MLYACIYILLQTSICAVAIIKATYKAAPGKEERKKMQDNDNPSYLLTEMPTNKSQEHQYMSVKLAPLAVADVEEHAELKANPAYLPVDLMKNN